MILLLRRLVVFKLFLVVLMLPQWAFADYNFDDIALGEEAAELIKKHNIQPQDASTTSSADSCETIAAKGIISCVWYVYRCKKNNSYDTSCPENNYCSTGAAIVKREDDVEKCHERESDVKKLKAWAVDANHVLEKSRFECSEEKTFRDVYNLLREGSVRNVKSLMRRNGCTILVRAVLTKVISFSNDKKVAKIQYRRPYFNVTTEGWTLVDYLIEKSEYQKGRL